MKLCAPLFLVFTLFTSTVVFGDDVPKFKDYKVKEIYKGTNHPLVMDEFSKRYRTRLRHAIKHGKPTFAGRYIVTRWGCGSGGCNTGAIIDARTGKAYAWPVFLSSVWPLKEKFKDEAGQELLYKINSRLIIFAGNLETSKTDGRDIVEFYTFKNGQFRFLSSAPYGKSKSVSSTLVN